MTARAVWYGRVARHDDNTDEQLRRQYEACRAYLQSGAEFVGCYVDVGASPMAARRRQNGDGLGLPAPYRGGLVDLLADAQAPTRRFDTVVCLAVDRISRRTNVTAQVTACLADAGVHLIAGPSPDTAASLAARRMIDLISTAVLQDEYARRGRLAAVTRRHNRLANEPGA